MEHLGIWPTFDLRVVTPRLELRALTPAIGFELAELAARGIHDPDFMPFLTPWSDVKPPQLQRNCMLHYFENWAAFQPNQWGLQFAVFEGETLMGSQNVERVSDYATCKSFVTGSWLGQEFHGRGFGAEMRAAVLHLMFDGLGAREAHTGAWEDNAPSLAVTKTLGYAENGRNTRTRRGAATTEVLFRLTREQWETGRRDDITVHGITDACLAFLGMAPDLSPLPAP